MLVGDQDGASGLPQALQLMSSMGCQSIRRILSTGLPPEQGNEGALTSVWRAREQGSFPGRADRISLQGWQMFCFVGQRLKPSHCLAWLFASMHAQHRLWRNVTTLGGQYCERPWSLRVGLPSRSSQHVPDPRPEKPWYLWLCGHLHSWCSSGLLVHDSLCLSQQQQLNWKTCPLT